MGEKTESATPKKRKDERKKGHVFMSRDAVSVATLFGAVFIFRIYFRTIIEAAAEFMSYCLTLTPGAVDRVPGGMFLQCVSFAVRTTWPLLLMTIFLSVGVTFAQTRGLVAFERIKPKFSNINPLEGFKRFFSLKSLIEAAKSLLKVTLLLWIVYSCLRDMLSISPRFMYADLNASCTFLLRETFSMMLRISLAFLVLAALDFLYQYWDFERQMKMSKQEVKEEYKQTEGDPRVKQRIKSVQRQMAQSRMMQNVPKADVIIRNPTHVAVALRYHYREDEAPVVLAMGVDALARRIIAVAERNDITIIENPPLARALYAEAELNRPIPSDLFEAVAEVMVYLYRLGRVRAEGASEDAAYSVPE